MEQDFAVGGRYLPGQGLQQGGFARAVMTEQRRYLAFLKRQADIVQYGGVTQANRQLVDFKKRWHSDSPLALAGRII